MPGRTATPLTTEDVQSRIRQLVGRKFAEDESELSLDAKLCEELGGDSISLLELAMEIEDEFDLEIPDDTLDRLRTTGQIVSYIEARLGFEEPSAGA